MSFRQRHVEAKRSTRIALTNVLSDLAKVDIAFDDLRLKKRESDDQIYSNMIRNYNSQKRHLAMHGAFLINEIPDLATDMDFNVLARAFNATGDFESAEKFFQQSIRKSPNQMMKLLNMRPLAKFWFDQGNAARGRKVYKEILCLNFPENDRYRYQIADTYFLWSQVEYDHGFLDESFRLAGLARGAAERIGQANLRTSTLQQFGMLQIF